MNNDEIFLKVRSIISEQTNKKEDEITMKTSFVQDLNADSLDIYELLYILEDEFGEKVPEDEANEFETVGDIVKFIVKRQSK